MEGPKIIFKDFIQLSVSQDRSQLPKFLDPPNDKD